MAKGDIKMRPRARRDHISSSTLSASSFTSRGKCSRWYRQAGTQIRCLELSDRHRLGPEGTAHSSQNVISMQMKGAGIRDRKVEMATSRTGCHGDWNLISSESSGAWSRWVASQEGRRRGRKKRWGSFRGNNIAHCGDRLNWSGRKLKTVKWILNVTLEGLQEGTCYLTHCFVISLCSFAVCLVSEESFRTETLHASQLFFLILLLIIKFAIEVWRKCSGTRAMVHLFPAGIRSNVTLLPSHHCDEDELLSLLRYLLMQKQI